MECSVDGCGRPAERGGLCVGHRKRKERGRPLDTPIRPRLPPWKALHEAGVQFFVEVDPLDDTAWQRAKWRFLDAVKRYARRR